MLPLAFGIGIAMTFQTALNYTTQRIFLLSTTSRIVILLHWNLRLALLVVVQPVDKPQLHDFSNIPCVLMARWHA